MSKQRLIQQLTGGNGVAEDEQGGQAERAWRDSTTPKRPSRNGAIQAHPLPPASRYKSKTFQRPFPIPNTGGMRQGRRLT